MVLGPYGLAVEGNGGLHVVFEGICRESVGITWGYVCVGNFSLAVFGVVLVEEL